MKHKLSYRTVEQTHPLNMSDSCKEVIIGSRACLEVLSGPYPGPGRDPS